ncbi:MAG: PPOX class F420-dependent oxidoreductase [Candidatus Hodarchaeota archaeon]
MLENPFNYLRKYRYISLTTFYRNGKGVATPVEFAEKDGRLYVNTRKESWKVKRIRQNPNAKIAPCTIRGKILGEVMNVTVRFLSKDEEVSLAEQALDEKLNTRINKIFLLLFKILGKIRFWKKPEERLFLEISP